MAGRFTMEAVFKAVDRWTAPITRMERGTAKSLKKIEKRIRSVDRAGQAFRRGVVQAGAAGVAAGAAVAVGAAHVAKAGIDFEQAITNVGAVSLKSRDQIADLEAKALSLGATTKFTATEVAQGMELMAKAGFSNADILSGVGGVLAAAAADGGELAETAGTVSNVLKGMGLEASQAGRVADVLALASARTNSTINTLGESMRNVSSTARQFGVSLEDSVAVVALLQDVGLDASVAGSAFNVMLTKLAKPPAHVAKQMKKMGVAFQDAEGNMLALPEVLKNIDKASKGAGGNMKAAALLADLVGLRGQKAAANLKDLFASGKFSSLADELDKAEGAAEKMANVKMDTLGGDLLKLEAAADAVQIALFNTENGSLRGIVQRTTEWIDANKRVFVGRFEQGMAFFRENGELIADVLGRIGRVVGVLLGVSLGFKVAAGAVWLFNLAMAASPLGLWITALTAVAALVAAFWPEISAFLADVGAAIVRVGESIWEHLEGPWDAVSAAAQAAWARIEPFFRAWAELQTGIGVVTWEAMKVVGSAIMGALTTLGEWQSGYWEGVWGFVRGGFNALVGFLTAIWEPFIPMIETVGNALVSVFRWAGGLIRDMWAPILDPIMSVVDSVRSIGRQALGGGGDDDEPERPRTGTAPVVPSPQQSIARTFSESRETVEGEITVRAEQGTEARVSRRMSGGLSLQSSGTF